MKSAFRSERALAATWPRSPPTWPLERAGEGRRRAGCREFQPEASTVKFKKYWLDLLSIEPVRPGLHTVRQYRRQVGRVLRRFEVTTVVSYPRYGESL